jgi:hypothetical protein
MKATYICVHVYDDGDTELTKLIMTEAEANHRLMLGDIPFNETRILNGDLVRELDTYGPEPEDVRKAVQHILSAEVNESCIVGKV